MHSFLRDTKKVCRLSVQKINFTIFLQKNYAKFLMIFPKIPCNKHGNIENSIICECKTRSGISISSKYKNFRIIFFKYFKQWRFFFKNWITENQEKTKTQQKNYFEFFKILNRPFLTQTCFWGRGFIISFQILVFRIGFMLFTFWL